ncbi:MAG: thioredoxin [Firmicutes bacterium]|nr:thioredoxin [Bacillota bacterium]
MNNNVVNVSDNTFTQEVLNAEQPVLVDFWAAWCGPCKMIAPVVEEIAVEYAGKIKVAKVNVDQNRLTPSQYGIMGIPTLILFKNGQPVERVIGYTGKAQLKRIIDQNLV